MLRGYVSVLLLTVILSSVWFYFTQPEYESWNFFIGYAIGGFTMLVVPAFHTKKE